MKNSGFMAQFEKVFEGSLLTMFCVIFSLWVLAQMSINITFGQTADFTSTTFMFAAYTSAPIIALIPLRALTGKGNIADKVIGFGGGIPAHYIASLALLTLYVFILSLFMDIERRVYIETLAFFTGGYSIVNIIAAIIALGQVRKANKNLQKIHENRGELN